MTAPEGRYVLHNRLGSGGFSVEAALTLAGLDFELVLGPSKPGAPNPESFRAVNPWNQVPVLITPGGTTLTESAAILAHLTIAHPDRGLGPEPGSDAHGAMLRWLVFMSVNLYEPILRRVRTIRYSTDEAGHEGVRRAAGQTLKAAFALIEAELGERPHLVGAALSVADIYLAMLNAWSGGGRGAPGCDALTRRVAAHPGIAAVWSRNFDHWLPTRWGAPA